MGSSDPMSIFLSNEPLVGRDVGDHPPITPMRAAPREEITKGNEWKIYDFVTRYYL